MQIERVFDENANLENILEGMIDANLNRSFEGFLNNLFGQANIENNLNKNYNTDEKIDCVTQNTDKGGTQS